MGLLDAIYSAGDSAKRQIRGLLADPIGYVEQVGGMLSDDIRAANDRNKRMVHNPESISKQDVSATLGSLLNFAPLGSIMYRGINGTYDPKYKQGIEWWSETPNLAKEYGSNVITKDINPKSPVDLGFRDFNTEVKITDVMDRIKKSIVDRFNSGQLDKNKAIELFDKADSYAAGEYKKVHQWLMDSSDALELLKGAGYDSIGHVERGTQTYGLLR